MMLSCSIDYLKRQAQFEAIYFRQRFYIYFRQESKVFYQKLIKFRQFLVELSEFFLLKDEFPHLFYLFLILWHFFRFPVIKSKKNCL